MLSIRHPWLPDLCPETFVLYYMAVCQVPDFGPLFCRLDADGLA